MHRTTHLTRQDRCVRIAAFVALTVLATAAQADDGLGHTPAFTVSGDAGQLYGVRVAAAGDVNADGTPDILVQAFDGRSAPVLVHSGLDGSVLDTIGGASVATFQAGRPFAGAGDVNADGHADVLIGNAEARTVRVVSGADGSSLRLIEAPDLPGFGAMVVSIGDVDGDDVPDIAVGAVDFAAGPSAVRVCSGATGDTLYTVTGDDVADGFGAAIDGIGDVDGDGVRDFVVGASGGGTLVENPGFPPLIPPFFELDRAGEVHVRSGATGAKLLEIAGPTADTGLGHSVAGIGDVTGDGIDDFIAGTGVFAGETEAGGFARVHSGADGSLVQTFESSPFDGQTGVWVAGPGDLNDDGTPDLLIARLNAAPLDAQYDTFSGADATLLWTRSGPATASGVAVASVGDLNADGTPDFAIATAEDFFGGGFAIAFTSRAAGAADDLDGDGTIGFGDLLVILTAWGACTGDCPADLDGDGTVGFGDVLVVLAVWGGTV